MVDVLHLVVSLGLIMLMDKFLKRVFVAAAIKLPSSLFGMFCVFTVLIVLDVTVPSAAKRFMDFFEPATLFIRRWLPLFYVPSLVVLPLAVRDIPPAAGLKICFIFSMSNFKPSSHYFHVDECRIVDKCVMISSSLPTD